MPCYDGRENERESANLSDMERETLQNEVNAMNGYLNGYAQMICDHCTKLEAVGSGFLITGELKNWWEAHKKWDKERKAKG